MTFQIKPLSSSIKTSINDILEKQEEADWENIYENNRKSLNVVTSQNQNLGYGSDGKMIYI